VIYLDSCALVKLVRQEPESAELVNWLDGYRGTARVSSVLVEVELERALRRNEPRALPGVPAVLGKLHRIEIDPTIRATAAAYQDPLLRTLDAIHLATAQVLASSGGIGLASFVTYDRRLLDAAQAQGLSVEHPGMIR
jgi:predicted nucleic acid-binding protein